MNRKKLVKDSPWHGMIREGTAIAAIRVLEDAKAQGEEVDIRTLASQLVSEPGSTPVVGKGSKRHQTRRGPKQAPKGSNAVERPQPASKTPVEFPGFSLPLKSVSLGSNHSASEGSGATMPRAASGPLFPPLAASLTDRSLSNSGSSNARPTHLSRGQISLSDLDSPSLESAAELLRNPPAGLPPHVVKDGVANVDALLEYVQKVLQVQQQHQQELMFQQLQQEVTTEEGLKRAFIRDIVPCIPRALRAWIFDRMGMDSEFSDYCEDMTTPARRFPGPHILLPLLTACKRLIVRHVTLPMFLPSLVHIILFSSVLCTMAVDPNSEDGQLENAGNEANTGSDWIPLAWPHTAKEVDSLLRICVGMSRRMGMNKEPIGRANVDEQAVEKDIRESKIIGAEVDLGNAGLLFMDGAGASVSADREAVTRRLWWLQYMTDRMMSFLVFRKPVIDDKDCYIYPPHLAKDSSENNGSHSPHSQAGSLSGSSSHDLGALEINEFDSISSDSLLRAFSLLGRAVNYRVTCQAYHINPFSATDPLRVALLSDLDLFRRALPKVAGAFDKPHRKQSSIDDYRNFIESLPRHAVRQLGVAMLIHDAAWILLSSPPSGNEGGSHLDWADGPAVDMFAEAAFRVVNIVTNVLYSDIFGADGDPGGLIGFAQVVAFQAAMALATLLINLQVRFCFAAWAPPECSYFVYSTCLQQKARGTPNAFRLEASINTPVRTINIFVATPSDPRAVLNFSNDLDFRMRSYVKGIEGLLTAFEIFKHGSAGWLAERASALIVDVVEGHKQPCPMVAIGKGWLSGSW